MSNERRRVGLLVKVLVSLGLLAALLSRQPLEDIREALAHPQWTWLLVAFAVYGVSAVAGALPWSTGSSFSRSPGFSAMYFTTARSWLMKT